MASSECCIRVQQVSFSYGHRLALDAVNLEVKTGEIFGLLGPNGGGKTTLFRLLTTYYPLRTGEISVLDYKLPEDSTRIRQQMGVVFQHPSLDAKLTVRENLKHHGRLYGIPNRQLSQRIDSSLRRVKLHDRAEERVERLSGGLARRAELAKGMLHEPRLLILDEPSTGLDPGARRDLWQYLRQLQQEGITCLLTTHLMEEAERCDRLAILDAGKIVAVGTPDELRATIGGDVITVKCADPHRAAVEVEQQTGIAGTVFEDQISYQSTQPFVIVPKIAAAVGEQLTSLEVAKPTLEDVFVRTTGHRFWNEADETEVADVH